MSANTVSRSFDPIPVLAIHVYRTDIPTNTGQVETTHTELESYYVTPEEARAGPYARKLSFQEAMQLFIV